MIALVISIIVMLILSGVSISAIVGEDGILNKATDAVFANSCAYLEEYINEYYVENYEEFEDADDKALLMANNHNTTDWFYKTSTTYVIDSGGRKHIYFIVENLPDEIRNNIKGGTSIGKTYADYVKGIDVYGLTSDLKVYYCKKNVKDIYGLDYAELERENSNSTVISADNPLAKIVANANGDEEVSDLTLKNIRTVKTLTITAADGVQSLNDLYKFTSLKNLVLDGVTLKSLSGIENILNFNYIYLKNTTIEDYSTLSKTKYLNYIYIERNGNTEEIDNIEVNKILDAMQGVDYNKLQYFGIFGSKQVTGNDYTKNRVCSNVKDISKMAYLTENTRKSIKYMYLNNNIISDISCLNKFPNLQLLKLESNKISNFTSIGQMKNMTNLTIANNLMSDISFFSNIIPDTTNYVFSNVTYLDLRDNSNIIDCSPIIYMSKLSTLYLSGCSNFAIDKVELIADFYNEKTRKNIDGKYSAYLNGNTKRVYSNKSLTDTSPEIVAMKNMSSENKAKVKKISLNGNPALTNQCLNDLLGSGFINCVALNITGCSNLTTLNFLENMPNLYELVMRDTGVVGDEVKKMDDYCSKIKCLSINGNYNIAVIPKTVSRCKDDATYANYCDNYYGGLKIDADKVPNLANCIGMTALSTYNMGNYNGTVDLSNCTNLKRIDPYTQTKFILPSSVTQMGYNQCGKIPDFSNCVNNIDYIYFNGMTGYTNSTDFTVMCQQLSKSTSLREIRMTPTCDFDFSGLRYLGSSTIQSISISRNGSNFLFTKLKDVDFTRPENENEYYDGENWFRNLNKFTANYTTFSNLNTFKDCLALSTLSITNSQISDITGLQNLTKLSSLNFSDNRITNLRVLSDKVNLTYLNLNDNLIYNTIYDEIIDDYVDNVEIIKFLNSKKLTSIHLLNSNLDFYDELEELKWSSCEW